MTGMNNAPVLAIALPHQFSAEDEVVSFALPENAFTDMDGDTLTLSATLADGTALPGWLVFDAVAGSFSGTPPQDFNGTLTVMVTASDGSLSASDAFALEITPVNDAPVTTNDIVGAGEFRVNEFTHSSQFYPSVTALANGHFVVTWQSDDGQQDDTSGFAIKARILNENGVEIVSEFRVNEFTDGGQLNPSVTALTNGHFVVTWQSDDAHQGDTSETAIKARIFDANGAEIVSEFLVNEFTDGPQRLPSVTALADGQFAVSWESLDQRQGDTDWAIKARIFDANGSEIVSELQVNEFTNGGQWNPSVATLTNGHFIVTWESHDQQQGDTSHNAIKARILDADGNEVVSEFLVNEFTDHDQRSPSVTALENGHFVVTWESHDGQQGDTDWAIKARIFDATGNEVVSEFLVNEFTHNAQHAPNVTTLANGHFVVTWHSYDGLQGDASSSAIKARIFDAAGNEIVSEFLVNEFNHLFQGHSSVTALANGDFVVTWESYDQQQGDADDSAVKARIFDANGVAQNPNPITEDVVTLIDTAALLSNDIDVDGDALTVTAVSATSAEGATLTLNSDGTISYDPRNAEDILALAEGETLTDSFTYTVEDGQGGESTATVSVVVHGANDAPVPPIALPDEFSAEDEAVSFTLPPDAFEDPNGDALTLSATLADGSALPDWLVFDAATESFSGTPPQDFNGILNVRVTASDGSLSTSETFALEITPVNDAPVAVHDSVGSSEFRVNEFTNDAQTAPSITALANGHFVVAWMSEDGQQGDTDWAIKARILDATGNEVVSEFLVNEFTNASQRDPSVTALANGDFVVTWESLDRQQGDPSDYAVKARVFDTDGSEIVSEFLVNEFTDNWQHAPSVTALANGHFVVTWESWDSQQGDTSDSAIKARIFDATGAEIVSEFLVNEFTDHDQRDPNVTALANGHFVVTWHSHAAEQGDPSGYAVKARIFDASGGEIVGEFLVNEFIHDTQWNSSVTALANGHFVVTWESHYGQQGDTDWAIKARIFDATGNEVVSEFLVNEFTHNAQHAPNVTTLANGNFVVTWHSYDGLQGDASSSAIKARIFDAAGNEIVSEFLVNEFNHLFQGHSSVTALANGDFVVTWQSLDGQQGDMSGSAIKARVFDAEGVAQGSTLITEDAVTLIETATLLANDSDVDGDVLTVTAVSAESAHGAVLTLNTDGTISYDPTNADAVRALERDQTLIDTFTYTVGDGNGGESTASVSVVVYGTNDAPVVSIPLPDQLSEEDEAVSFALPANAFIDPNGDALTLSATLTDGTALPGWLVFDAVAGSFSGTPPQDFNGILSVTVTASDGSLSASNTFALEITPVNDAPEDITLAESEVQEHDDGAVIGTLSVSDPDVGDTFTYSVDDDRFEVLGNTLKLKEGVSLDYESETQVILTVTATDSGNLSTSKTFTLDVGDVYDPVVNVELVITATSRVATLSGTMDYYTIATTDNGLIELTALGGGAVVGGADTFRFEDDGSEFTISQQAGGNNVILTTFNGGDGNDTLNLSASSNNETLLGMTGDDSLTGGSGEDALLGHEGNDILNGGAGNDTLTGGSGDDTFVFDPGFGEDIITDFVAGAATDDVIEFRGVTNLTSYADVLNNVVDDGTDTSITLDNDNSIVLKNVVVSDLSSDDFRFFA